MLDDHSQPPQVVCETGHACTQPMPWQRSLPGPYAPLRAADAPSCVPPACMQVCPPGSECPAAAVSPKPCRPGFYADLKKPFCLPCPKGTFQGQAAQRACKPCPAGAYCPATKMVAPTPCPAGRFSTKLSSVAVNDCAKCPINVSVVPCLCRVWRPSFARTPLVLGSQCMFAAPPPAASIHPHAADLLSRGRRHIMPEMRRRAVDCTADRPEDVLVHGQAPALRGQPAGAGPSCMRWQCQCQLASPVPRAPRGAPETQTESQCEGCRQLPPRHEDRQKQTDRHRRQSPREVGKSLFPHVSFSLTANFPGAYPCQEPLCSGPTIITSHALA